MLAVSLMRVEMIAFALLAMWMAHSVWRSQRGDKRYGDTARLIVLSFSLLLVYRDWRILYVDTSDQAKIIMVVCGLTLCLFTGAAARAYGRGARLS